MTQKIKILTAACFVAGALQMAPAWAGEFTNWMPPDRKGDGTGGGQVADSDPLPAGVDVPMGEPGTSAGSSGGDVASPIAKVKPKPKEYSPIGRPPASNGGQQYSPIGRPAGGGGTSDSGNGQYSPIEKVVPPVARTPFAPNADSKKCAGAIPRMCNNGSLAVIEPGTCRKICPEDSGFRDGP